MSYPKSFWFGYKYALSTTGIGAGIADGKKKYISPFEKWIAFDKSNLLLVETYKWLDYDDGKTPLHKPKVTISLYQGDFEIVGGEFMGGTVKSKTDFGELVGIPFANKQVSKYYLNDYKIGQELPNSNKYSVNTSIGYTLSPGSSVNTFDIDWTNYSYDKSWNGGSLKPSGTYALEDQTSEQLLKFLSDKGLSNNVQSLLLKSSGTNYPYNASVTSSSTIEAAYSSFESPFLPELGFSASKEDPKAITYDELYGSIDWLSLTYEDLAQYLKAKPVDWGMIKFDKLNPSTLAKISWVGGDGFVTSPIDTDKISASTLNAINWDLVDFATFSKDTYNGLDWSEIDLSEISDSTYSKINWNHVDFKKLKNQNLLDWSKISFEWVKNPYEAYTIDWSTVPLNKLSPKDLNNVDWSEVGASTLPAETYAQLDWAIVNIGDIKGESLSALDWSLIKVGDLQTEELKKVDWSAVNTSTFSAETYSQLDWSTVTIGAFTQESKKTLDWSKVKVGGEDGLIEESLSTTDLLQISLGTDISSVNFKKTDWNSVSFGEFSSQSYQGIEWSQMKMNKLNSSTYSTIDWSEVQFGEFAKKQYKQTNWSQIGFDDFQAEDYNEVNWAQVKFKGSKAPNVAELDMSLVVEADSFSKKNAKQINWGQLSTDDLSSDALSKLEGFNVKKKGVNVVDLLSPGTQSNALSFAGVDGGGSAWTPVASPEAATGSVFPIAATDGSELMFV